MPQLTTYLTTQERRSFGDYAEKLGLDAGGLATLLLLRELRVGDLKSRLEDVSTTSASQAGQKITVRRLSEDKINDLQIYASSLDLRSSEVLLAVCRLELEEMSISKVLGFS